MERREALGAPSSLRDSASGECTGRPIDPRMPAPNFFIVGAAKAGTTSLHAYLSRHPEVFMSPLKEPHYFSSFEVKPEFDNFIPAIRDAKTYQELFAGSERYKAVGEASPSYLCDADAARRIRLAIPDAKIIISLRDPVQRAYSHYLMEFRQGRETHSFGDALASDRLRREKGWGVSFQYVELGLYAEQVERYLAAFGNSNVLVILFEDLVRETPAVMKEVADFLEIDSAEFPRDTFDRVHNSYEVSRGRVARLLLRSRPIRQWSRRWIPQVLRTAIRSRILFTIGQKPTMDEATRRSLAGLFAADLQRLERMLGRDLDSLRESW